jgi:hypothetical protein
VVALGGAVVAVSVLYRRAESETGSERSMTASISMKIAVVPPIPKASVSTAAAVNTPDTHNCLAAYRIEPIRRSTVGRVS